MKTATTSLLHVSHYNKICLEIDLQIMKIPQSNFKFILINKKCNSLRSFHKYVTGTFVPTHKERNKNESARCEIMVYTE